MNYKISYLLFQLGSVLACIFCGAAFLTDKFWYFIPAVIVMFATMAQVMLFLRCPHCGKALNPKGHKEKFCPECGEYIEWKFRKK